MSELLNMNFILTLVLTAGIMLVPVVLASKVFASRSWTNFLLLFGVVYILLYGICVAVPYHFQGYSEVAAYEATEALGLTRFLPVGLFAYIFTFTTAGYSWTATAMCMVAVGGTTENVWYELVLKIASILLGALYMLHMTAYSSTINYALE